MSQRLVILLIFFVALLGCSAPSSLKSNTEITLNKAFHTNFDYIDTIGIHHYSAAGKKELLNRIIKNDKVSKIVNELSTGKKYTKDIADIEPKYSITFITSPEGYEYNKRQRQAEMDIVETSDGTIIHYQGAKYLLPVKVMDRVFDIARE